MTRKLIGLLEKDLLLHWREIVGSWAGSVIFMLILTWKVPPENLEQKLVLLISMNFFLNIFYTEFLIYREKTKGTLAWLRSMPLADAHIVSSKFIGLCALHLIGFGLTTAVIAPEFFRDLGTFCVTLFGMMSFGAIMLITRWFFNQRFGQVIPLGVLVLAALALMGAKRTVPGLKQWLAVAWPTATFKAAICVLGGAWIALMWLVMTKLLSCRDTAQLVE